MWSCLEIILKRAMDGNLLKVMDRPLRKGKSEWEKAEKIHNIEPIMLDMLIIYKFLVQSSHNHFYNVRNNLC